MRNRQLMIYALAFAATAPLVASEPMKKAGQHPIDPTKYNGAPIRKIKRGKKKK